MSAKQRYFNALDSRQCYASCLLEDVYYKNGSAFGMHTNLNLHYSLKETIYALFQRGK